MSATIAKPAAKTRVSPRSSTPESHGPANVLTLSCKNRLTCQPEKRRGGCRDQHAVAVANCSRRDARVQFEPSEVARRRASGPAVFVSL